MLITSIQLAKVDNNELGMDTSCHLMALLSATYMLDLFPPLQRAYNPLRLRYLTLCFGAEDRIREENIIILCTVRRKTISNSRFFVAL